MGKAVELEKTYDPSASEDAIYRRWLDAGYFHAEIDPAKKPYTIVIPPPNITGQLHLGHAMDNTIIDILIRWRRMQGYSALWMPGTDHASIATEARIVATLEEEGTSKGEIGREKFLERAWRWKEEYGGRIVEQLKKLGSSCDWARERFTLDEGCSRAVEEVFCRLYAEGLIYRGERIVNWCPHCVTSISDIEVEYSEQQGHFWHVRYPLADGSGGYIEVATTRPETMLGDTAIAVNPEDGRYSALVGKTCILPLMNREIPIVADEYVDREFGTGAVKVTPAHDPNDFEIGQRHNLAQIRVMDDRAVMNANAGAYEGMDRYAAREKIVADLEAQGFLVKVEPHAHNVGECQRCKTTIEPIMSLQWFVKMKPLAEPAIACVREGETRFVPERFSSTYYNWMENIHDWCISRQLWWGHRIPVYYCKRCGEVIVQRGGAPAGGCPKCGAGADSLEQDPDTLDTWFSSALWPFSTMGWPDDTPEMRYFYPTDVLSTGYDIIFFWVARMIFSAIHNTGRAPFHHVLIHGLIRDAQGRKMSKSLGNGVDPLDVIAQHGADALRFAITAGNAPGNDLRFSDEKIESAGNFANKIWNAARFVLMNLPESGEMPEPAAGGAGFAIADRWILSEFNRVAGEVTENMEKFEMGIALQKIYDFVWDEFCDWYIELVKPRLTDEAAPARAEALYALRYVLAGSMKLLHPFMPFVTERIFTALAEAGGGLAGDRESVMVSPWPVYDAALDAPKETAEMGFVMAAIRGFRNLRSEMDVPPSRKVTAVFVTGDAAKAAALEEGRAYVERLAGLSAYEVAASHAPADAAQEVTLVADGVEIFIPLGELVDLQKERARLEKELDGLKKEIARSEGRLANEGFVSKAPERVIAEEREKLAKYKDAYAKVEQSYRRVSQ